MRVLVTGGSGRVGQAVIADLMAHGHDAINADRRPPPSERDPSSPAADAPYRETNLSDVGQVAWALSGCDAVVHLGAIPAPYRHPDEVVYNNNTGATFAVLQAAKLLGLRRAVVASSISALGTAWTPTPFAPRYAPVDEEHPLLVHDAYGLSKEVDERICEMFHRQTGMTIAALRFHWVALHAEAAAKAAELRADPGIETWWQLLWGYVDVRDVATACRLSLEADGFGFEAFNIVAADTLSETPTEELIRSHASSVEVRSPIPGTTSAFSIEKARRLLGWEPRHSWRSDGDDGEP